MLKANSKTMGLVACLMMGAFGISACRQDMHDNPKFKAYRDGGMRQLPEGAVARGSLELNPAAPKVTVPAPAASPAAGAQASASPPPQPVPTGEDGFPFKVSAEILDRGENRYNISCLPCHGTFGDGNGMIVQRGFKRPPSYHEERLRKAPSSYFYDVVTNGFGQMSSYTDQLTPEDRWKVIAYIRVLQLSQRATLSELAEKDKQDIEKRAEEAASKKGTQTGGAHGGGAAPAPTPASGGHSN